MSILAKHRITYTLIVVAVVLAVATTAIFYARGFKPNLQKRSIERTGLLVANSTPTGANVYLDGRLTSATNTTITYLEPKTYKIKIEKDGYTSWEKDMEIKADLAVEIEALLFPLAPEIKPLTTTGATNPTLSPNGGKIVYGTSGTRGGAYILSMERSPLPFSQNARLIAKNTTSFDFSKSDFIWDPDSKELIAVFEGDNVAASANLILNSETTDQEPRDITASLAATIASWQQTINERAQTAAIPVPDEVKSATTSGLLATGISPVSLPSPTPSPKTAKQSPTARQPDSPIARLNYHPTGMIFSPDEEKVLYKNSEEKYKIYDLKLKQEFTLPDLPDLINISFFPDSKHLVIAQKDAISIIETDSNNKITVYSGKFENGFVFAHPSGTRLIILTTLAQTEGSPPNLYSINLR